MAKVGKASGYQEIHGKLSFFGWVWRILMVVWQAVMVGLFLGGVSLIEESSDPWDAGFGIIGIGFTMIFWFWGTLILGLFVLLTRRTKAIVPVLESGRADAS